MSLPRSSSSALRCCLTVGNFDGVHHGHQQMVFQLVAMARRLDEPAVAVTFDPPPLKLLAPERFPPQLTTLKRKIELLGRAGVDEVVVLPTTPALLQMSPEEFVERIIIQQFGCQGMVEGPNFRFGQKRAGDVQRLRELAAGQFPLEVVDAVHTQGAMVSSSAVRSAIQAGHVGLAGEMLGRPYELQGRIGQGAQRGRTIGFPTANLEQIETLPPPPGVYAARTRVADTHYPVALHIGPNPTFGEGALKIEAHLIGFTGDLYGSELTIELFDHLRGIERFTGVEALVAQLNRDVAATRERISAVSN